MSPSIFQSEIGHLLSAIGYSQLSHLPHQSHVSQSSLPFRAIRVIRG
jgi:hypothetical protein